MRCIAALVVSVSAVGWVLPGCVADHPNASEPETRSDDRLSQLADEPANPPDPFGSCADHVDDGIDETTCSIAGLDCSGWAVIGPCAEGECESAHYWETCRHQCEQASDCPVPATGDAVPRCTHEGTYDICTLPCDEDTVCPDGFICAFSNIGSGEYAWGSICVEHNVFEPYTYSEASPIDEPEPPPEPACELPNTPPNPEDPFGTCADYGSSWPIECSTSDLGCTGWGEVGLCDEGQCEFARNWMTCIHECTTASDCPVPATGNAVPECAAPDEFCVLPCDEATVCPDGFVCANPSTIGSQPDELWGNICVEYKAQVPFVHKP